MSVYILTDYLQHYFNTVLFYKIVTKFHFMKIWLTSSLTVYSQNWHVKLITIFKLKHVKCNFSFKEHITKKNINHLMQFND